jgi:cell division protein FtsI (penicillin-binding protein 3)
MSPKGVRLALVSLLVFFIFLAFEIRAFYFQFISRDEFMEKINRQHYTKLSFPSKRGRILDREGKEMALSMNVPSIYGVPSLIENEEEVARSLAHFLDLDPKELQYKLSTNRHFVWIKRHVSPGEWERVKELNIKGIGMIEEPKRFYPYKELASVVLGFVNLDHEGLEGVEKAYEKFLRAPLMEMVIERDGLGRPFLPLEKESEEGPWDVYLTLDVNVQYILERALQEGLEQYRAKRAVGLIMDPVQGDILGMASLPSFNPNCFWLYPSENRKNLATLGLFEPGSTLKPFLVATALENGFLKPNDIVFCEGGRYNVFGITIRDVKSYDWLSVQEVIKFSSNIGAAKIARTIGADDYYKILKSFGFGEKTGVGLPEEKGVLKPPKLWTPVDLMTLGFGQGMSCTPLQIVTAYSALANGGLKVKPRIVKEMRRVGDGKVLVTEPQVGKRVLSPEVSRLIMGMLEKVVLEGTGTKAFLEGYSIAGKTGTAQKYDPRTGTYSRERFVASFVGIFPADRPRAVVLVMFDEPKTSIYGGEVAAPVFRKIVQELAQYWKIPPKSTLAMSEMRKGG